MKKSAKEQIKLGVFVVLGSVLLVTAAYLIGNQQNMFSRTFEISAVFTNVNGLQPGNNVRFSGIPVGTVSSITMENDTSIRVSMNIRNDMMPHIRKNALAAVGSDGLVGSMLINIIPGNSDAPLISPGDQLQTYSRISSQDMLTTLNVTNENAALLTAELLEVTRAVRRGKGTLGRLLNDTAMAYELRATIKNLERASAASGVTLQKLNSTLDRFGEKDNTLGMLLNDEELVANLKSTFINLDSTVANTRKMTDELHLMLQEAKSGKGAFSYLVSDTVLVEELKHTFSQLDSGMTSFNQNMEALKHNFLTRRYFRKLEKENQKSQKE